MNVRIFGVGLILAGSLAMASSAGGLQASGRLQPAAISVDVGTVDRISDFGESGGRCFGRTQIDGEVLGNKLLFRGDDGLTGCELWITDGTHGGTMLVKDIATGVGSGGFPNGSYPGDFVVLANGRAVFQARDAPGGRDFWVTDGTSAGTMLVKDDFGASEFAVLPNGRAAFQANGVLWITDGTSAGTMFLKDIATGVDGYGNLNESRIFGLTVVGANAYFWANDGVNGDEPWVTDGTSASTTLVADINNSGDSSPYAESSSQFIRFGDQVYFQASNGINGIELWSTSPVSGGARIVADIRPGSGGSLGSVTAIMNCRCERAKNFVSLNGRLVFWAYDGSSVSQLWAMGDFPGPPQNVAVDSVTLTSASISWSPPSLVGTGVTSYTVRSNPGGYTCSTTTLSCTVTGLTTNAFYTFTVVATGATGGGLPTTSPRARMLVILPGPSRSVAVSPSSHSASVSWLAPATGGIGIELYTVTSNPSGFACTTATLSCTVTGLLSNQDYTFTVVATNPRGDGPSVTSSLVRTQSPQLGSLVDSLTSVSNIVSDSVLHPGDALNVLYSGFNPNELVLLLIASNPVVIGSANADVNGNVVFLTTIPAGTATGSHHLVVYAPVSGFGASQAVTVTIPSPAAGTTRPVVVDNPTVDPDTLPATGGGVIPFLIALTLLIAGFALLAGRSAVSQWVLVLGRRV